MSFKFELSISHLYVCSMVYKDINRYFMGILREVVAVWENLNRSCFGCYYSKKAILFKDYFNIMGKKLSHLSCPSYFSRRAFRRKR
ncbi:hypothetical protein DB42_DV00010 [Neochlamydia sp. EPS4]|nr:hypothetical protein DB42_DV00010 [Neochlamydia sp. EPS4]